MTVTPTRMEDAAGREVKRRRGWVLVVATLAVGLIGTASASILIAREASAHQRLEFEATTHETLLALERRVDAYSEVLFGLRSLFAASQNVGRGEFHDFLAVSDVEQRFPGFQALEYTRVVDVAERAAFEESVRTDTSLDPAGYPEFSVHPRSERQDLFVVDFVEPRAGNEAAFGFDLGSDEARRRAIEVARDTGELVATSGITLVQDSADMTGFLLLLAVYEGGEIPATVFERRQRFVGVVNAVLVVDDLVSGAWALHDVDLELYDAGDSANAAAEILPAAQLLFDSNGDSALKATGRRIPELAVGGRRWLLLAEPLNGTTGGAERILQWVIPIGGVVLSLIAAALALTLARSRSRAMDLALVMTADLAVQTEELVAARDEAQSADRAKSEFLATMSHEIRTPLNSVIGFTNILLKNKGGNLTEKQISYLGRVGSNGEHLLEVINEILDLSKIEAGSLELVSEPVAVGELAGTVAVEMEGNVPEGVELATTIPDGLQPIQGDAGRLKQVLINLVGNALKFTQAGIVHVVVAADADGSPRRIEVVDTGIGVAEEDLVSIFDPFQQADTSTSRQFEGTGLGLAITRRLLQVMGHEISVESKPDVGSTFTITLNPGAAPSNNVTPIRPPSEAEGGHLVLCVDDDQDQLAILREQFESFGCRVVTATRAAEALQMARLDPPNLVTTDLLMPDHDGWWLVDTMRADPTLVGIPVAVISAIGTDQRRDEPGVSILQKPAHESGLRRLLEAEDQPARASVLLVDDDPEARLLISAYLQEEAVDLIEATNGSEALELMQTRKPSLVVLDLLMPVMDGRAMLARMRSDPQFLDIPVLVATAKELTEVEAQELNRTATRVVGKGAGLEQQVVRAVRDLAAGAGDG